MRRVQKRDLPSKTCLVCARPFTWRKKWERDWQNVMYCSVRCAARKARSSDTVQPDATKAGASWRT